MLTLVQRPFIYFSAPIFLLYELSSPFLNIHWFCDKLDLTGSTLQAVNGVCLVLTFFGCRLVWGIYSSCWVFRDMYWIIRDGNTNFAAQVPLGEMSVLSTQELLSVAKDPQGQLFAFNTERYMPVWIPAIYLASNLVLNSLNIFWFGKMIETIRTRFDPPWGTKGLSSEKVTWQPKHPDDQESEDSDLGVGEPGKSRQGADGLLKQADGTAGTKIERSVYEDGHHGVEVTGSATRSARSRRKA